MSQSDSLPPIRLISLPQSFPAKPLPPLPKFEAPLYPLPLSVLLFIDINKDQIVTFRQLLTAIILAANEQG